MSKVFLVLVFALLCQSCTGADRVATYTHKNSGATISIALTSVHRHLAEYDRDLIVQTVTGVMKRKKLFPDTGGNAAANLYLCSDGKFLVEGYGEQTKVDLVSGEIESGSCKGTRSYVGIFDGAGSMPWQFYTSSERAERTLEMQGG